NTGRLTPDTIIFLDYDIYELTLKKKYFRDTTLYVEIKENEESEISVNYYTNPLMYGEIHLTSVPSGAQVLINDSLINKTTPYTLPGLLPGEYELTFKLFDHKDTRLKAIVKSNETSYYTGVLRDTSVWVDYQVSNSGIASNNLSAIA